MKDAIATLLISFAGCLFAIATAVGVANYYGGVTVNGITYSPARHSSTLVPSDTFGDQQSYYDYGQSDSEKCHDATETVDILKDRTFKVIGLSTRPGDGVVAHAYNADTGGDLEVLCLKAADFHIPTQVRVEDGKLQFSK